jgi:predicted GNAT family N-acyltransferase
MFHKPIIHKEEFIMLNLNYYSGSVNGSNYQEAAADTTRTTVINVINRVCNMYSIDENILLGVMNAHPSEFIGYVLNTNDVRKDKMVQNLIEDAIEEAGCIYDDETIDEILAALDIS